MSRIVFTPELVRELIDYDPETGVMTWRERRAQLYLDLVPGISMEAALSRAGRFNMTWAGREVGTDQVYKSVNRRVRISFGRGITAVRKNATTVAWMLGAGREPQPGKEVITWDGNPRNLAAENIVEVSTPVRYILELLRIHGETPPVCGHWKYGPQSLGSPLTPAHLSAHSCSG